MQGFCTDGECFDDTQSQNNSNDFAKTTAGLAAIAGAAKDVHSEQDIAIFAGEGISCGESTLGLYNCCQAESSFLHNCSAKEQKLYHAQRKGVAFKTGEGCGEGKKFLGICLSKHQGWCVYKDKLAKVTQEQGKKQLGLAVGDKERPICTGFSTEQFQNINFDAIDFSEVYADLKSKMKFPDQEIIIKKMKNKYQNKFTEDEK
jgi:conjugal transfer mating pair stabilization protein TraN